MGGEGEAGGGGVLGGRGRDGEDGVESDEGGVLQLEEVVEFAVGAFGVDEVLEGVDDFLDGINLFVFFVEGLVDDAIGSLANPLANLKLPVDVVIQLFSLLHGTSD